MISKAFAEALAAGRPAFNWRAQEARRRHPTLDLDAFRQFLEDGVGCVVDAVAAVERERLHDVALVAYDVALELAGRALVGPTARSQLVAGVWRELIPHLARLVAAHPAKVLGMLSNAAVYLEGVSGVRTGQWMSEMASLAPRIGSLEQLGAVGQILAWRAGAAHFRAGAFTAAGTLPDALALEAFHASEFGSWQLLKERAGQDPWWGAADGNAAREREIGAFSGFGGQFPVPPQVRAGLNGFVVRSADRHFFLIADAYGAVLQSASREEFEGVQDAKPRNAYVVQSGALRNGSLRIPLDLPEAGLTICATATTIAIASPYTHAIRLLPHA